MKILYVIPARGGSKGLLYKNIKLLNGKPLICYTIDVARQLSEDTDICVSSDDDKIIEIVEQYGLKVPFKRPDYLATDTATTNDVILHALDYYENIGIHYDTIILLQPTSPFRKTNHIIDALKLYNNTLDMVVSVKKSKSSSVICRESNNGLLAFCLNKNGLRRQDLDDFYEYNGSIYIINTNSLKKFGLSGLRVVKKYLMEEAFSIDIDSENDWLFAEFLSKQINNEDNSNNS